MEGELWEITTEEEKRQHDIIRKSFLGKLLQDPDITDISYNGKTMWVQHNKRGRFPWEDQPKTQEVERVIGQITDEQKKKFTPREPRLETEIGILRVNAMHPAVSPDGISMSLRVSRPELVVPKIREMTTYKNEKVEQLLAVFKQAKINTVISGETGTGKTELQKLLVGHMRKDSKITLIEDTRDSHIKDLYPEMDIDSWQIYKAEAGVETVSAQELVQSALRNNPDWILLAETRGKEAADMLDAVKTGHGIITTLHAESAILIPSRLIPMIRQSESYGSMSEVIIGKEIAELLRIGVHLDLQFGENGAERRIKEIAEFTGYTTEGIQGTYLFREVEEYNEETQGYKRVEEYGKLSAPTVAKLTESKMIHLVPKEFLP